MVSWTRTDNDIGRRWTIAYAAAASPAQIDDFYRTTANGEQFTSLGGVQPWRRYRQERSGAEFSYAITRSDALTSQVVFIAKSPR
jgi:hypothetical protein